MSGVPQLRKTQWPVHITDALGIPSIQGLGGPWHSTGDTTDVAWFHAMCDVLGITYPGERIRAMRAILETAGGIWDQQRHSSDYDGKQAGGNVRKEAFEDLWLALHRSGHLDLQDERSTSADALTRLSGRAPEMRYTYRAIRLRQGQPAFRAQLLRAYDGRCAISGSDIREALEAAHIVAHAAGGTTTTSNGLLLRADLHTLFDLRLIAVDTSRWKVVAHASVRNSNAGAALHGSSVRRPRNAADQPDRVALDEHRRLSGL